MLKRVILLSFGLFLGGSVVYAADPAKTTYAEHVLPILREKCLNCHNADKSRGGLDLSTYGKTMEGGSSGAVIKPGHPDDSRLVLLTSQKSEPKMPPEGSALSADALTTLRRWIDQGALENATS